MKFTDLFIRRPVLATVVSLLILIIGLRAIFSLDVRQYPELNNTVVTVTTSYPGASSELIKGFISNRTKRPFDAHLVLKPDGNVKFEFPPRPARKRGAKKATKKTSTKAEADAASG